MFYLFSRFLIRLARPIYLNQLVILHRERARAGRPLLFASNHSGSFFDALILGSIFSQRMHTFARGDVFRKPAVAKWLRRINLIPAYRGTEGGREHLMRNEASFRVVRELFQQQETILIFSEGICVNEWHLRPLAKGTARLAWQTWFGENPQPEMEVVPTGLTYDHFRGGNKKVLVQFGEPLRCDSLKTDPQQAERWLREFTEVLTERMRGSILETATHQPDPAQLADRLPPKSAPVFLRPLAGLGRLLHRPLSRWYRNWVAKKTAGTVFYDSVLFGILIYTYPALIGLLALLIALLTAWYWGLLFFVGMPLLALLGNQYR